MKVEIDEEFLRSICYWRNEYARDCSECTHGENQKRCPLEGKKEGAQL